MKNDDENALWRDRGKQYARRLLLHMSATDLLASLFDSQSSSTAVALDEALDAFNDPDRARRRADIRRTFLEGAVSIVMAAGGLQLGAPSESDVLDGLARARDTDADRRRC